MTRILERPESHWSPEQKLFARTVQQFNPSHHIGLGHWVKDGLALVGLVGLVVGLISMKFGG